MIRKIVFFSKASCAFIIAVFVGVCVDQHINTTQYKYKINASLGSKDVRLPQIIQDMDQPESPVQTPQSTARTIVHVTTPKIWCLF